MPAAGSRTTAGDLTAPPACRRLAATGQALVEYGLILTLIAVVAIGALLHLGGQTSAALSDVGTQIESVGGPLAATTPPTDYTTKKQCTAANYTWVKKTGKVAAHCE
jgi:Flp pilus assembly pilin Flp